MLSLKETSSERTIWSLTSRSIASSYNQPASIASAAHTTADTRRARMTLGW